MSAQNPTPPRPDEESATRPLIVRAFVLALAFVTTVALAACAPVLPQDEAVGGEPAILESPAVPTEEPVTSATTEAPTTEAPTTEAPTTEAPTTTAAPTPTPAPEPVAAEGTALAQLAGLEEKGRAPTTDYDRELFGWRDDMDRNGCDTRYIWSGSAVKVRDSRLNCIDAERGRKHPVVGTSVTGSLLKAASPQGVENFGNAVLTPHRDVTADHVGPKDLTPH